MADIRIHRYKATPGSPKVRSVPPLLRSRERELRFEGGCDEFPGRRGSHFVIPVASDPTMDSARAGALESDGGR